VEDIGENESQQEPLKQVKQVAIESPFIVLLVQRVHSSLYTFEKGPGGHNIIELDPPILVLFLVEVEVEVDDALMM